MSWIRVISNVCNVSSCHEGLLQLTFESSMIRVISKMPTCLKIVYFSMKVKKLDIVCTYTLWIMVFYDPKSYVI